MSAVEELLAEIREGKLGAVVDLSWEEFWLSGFTGRDPRPFEIQMIRSLLRKGELILVHWMNNRYHVKVKVKS